MKIAEVEKFGRMHPTEFRCNDEVKKICISRKNGPVKFSLKNCIFFDPIVDDSETDNVSAVALVDSYDCILIKAFDTSIVIDESHIRLLDENDIVLFRYDSDITNIYVAALVRSSVFKDGFRFSNDLSYLHLNELDRFNKAVISCKGEISDDEWFAYLDEKDIIDVSEYIRQNAKAKNVIYTYAESEEDVPVVQTVDTFFDYICFTNALQKDVANWNVVKMDGYDENFFKLHPELFFNCYEKSIWVSRGSIVKRQIRDIIDMLEKEPVLTMNDDRHSTLYSDAIDSRFEKELILSDFPKTVSPIDSSLILRKHNSDEWRRLAKRIYFQMLIHNADFNSAFVFALWKHGGAFLRISSSLARIAYI